MIMPQHTFRKIILAELAEYRLLFGGLTVLYVLLSAFIRMALRSYGPLNAPLHQVFLYAVLFIIFMVHTFEWQKSRRIRLWTLLPVNRHAAAWGRLMPLSAVMPALILIYGGIALLFGDSEHLVRECVMMLGVVLLVNGLTHIHPDMHMVRRSPMARRVVTLALVGMILGAQVVIVSLANQGALEIESAPWAMRAAVSISRWFIMDFARFLRSDAGSLTVLMVGILANVISVEACFRQKNYLE